MPAAATTSRGSSTSTCACSAFFRNERASASLSSSTSERPRWPPLALRKVFAIAPPMRSWLTRPSRFSSTPILSETLAPPMIAMKGRSTSPSSLPRNFTSRSMSRPMPLSATNLVMPDRRRVRAVGGAEGVVDVDVGVAGEAAREGLVVGLLGRREAQVLEQGDAAVAQIGDDLARAVADRLVGERDVDARAARPGAPRPASSEYFGSGLPLGRPRCEARTTRAPLLDRVLDRRQALADARVVGDPAGGRQRHVEVDADEQATATNRRARKWV